MSQSTFPRNGLTLPPELEISVAASAVGVGETGYSVKRDRKQNEHTDVSGADAERLMKRISEFRDKTAFQELYRLYAPRLKGFFLKAGCESDVAEEISQETMISVWRKAAMFDPAKAKFSTWLFTVARNKRIDLIRRQNRPQIDETMYLATVEPIEMPDEQVSQIHDRAQVEAILKYLPAEQLHVLKMAFFEEKSHQMIADETGIPLGTIKSRIRLALGRLKTVLETE